MSISRINLFNIISGAFFVILSVFVAASCLFWNLCPGKYCSVKTFNSIIHILVFFLFITGTILVLKNILKPVLFYISILIVSVILPPVGEILQLPMKNHVPDWTGLLVSYIGVIMAIVFYFLSRRIILFWKMQLKQSCKND